MKNNKKSKLKFIDLAVLILLPAVITLLCWHTKIHFLFSSLLYFGLPAVFLSYRKPSAIKRALIFSSVFGIIGGLIYDYLGTKNNAWFVPTIFHFRILSVVPIEDLVWAFLVTYLSVMFYEYFFDKRPHRLLGRKMPYFFALIFMGLFVLIFSISIVSHLLIIRYFYIRGSLILLGIPSILFYCFWPRYLTTVIKMFPYFFALGLTYELLALHSGYWYFPSSQYIGWITVNVYRFPIEELIFWVMLWDGIVLACFEFFDDNNVSAQHLPILTKLKLLRSRVQ